MTKPVVLLVDDDPGVRFTLSEVLADADVEVIEAADGLEALDRLSERRADLVITDLKMPRMDGMALLSRIRAKDPSMKVVMITAHGSEAAAVEAMKLGAYDYFPKPFDVDAVAAVVKRATEATRLLSENRRLKAVFPDSSEIFHPRGHARPARRPCRSCQARGPGAQSAPGRRRSPLGVVP